MIGTSTRAPDSILYDAPGGACVAHLDHSPVALLNELHHVFPAFWQIETWGKIEVTTRVCLCGTGHSNVHYGLDYFRGRVGGPGNVYPLKVVGKTRALAVAASTSYTRARAGMSPADVRDTLERDLATAGVAVYAA